MRQGERPTVNSRLSAMKGCMCYMCYMCVSISCWLDMYDRRGVYGGCAAYALVDGSCIHHLCVGGFRDEVCLCVCTLCMRAAHPRTSKRVSQHNEGSLDCMRAEDTRLRRAECELCMSACAYVCTCTLVPVRAFPSPACVLASRAVCAWCFTYSQTPSLLPSGLAPLRAPSDRRFCES
jgi:hypothetical protein